MEILSVEKMNFTSREKPFMPAQREPRHSSESSGQTSPNVFVAYGPLATMQRTSVSHASPIFSARFVLSGKIGASERVPQIRGLKVGTIRKGAGFTKLSRRLCSREEFIQPAQSVIDSFEGSCVGKAQISRRRGGVSPNDCH